MYQPLDIVTSDRQTISVTWPNAVRNGLILTLVIWMLVSAAYHSAMRQGVNVTGIDFNIFYRAARSERLGLPIYHPHGELYAYSPLPAILMRPLTELSMKTALKVWFLVNTACLITSVFVYCSAARLTIDHVANIGVMLIVAFRSWPVVMNFALGQMNFLLLLLFTGMIWADSRKRWKLLAVLIIVAGLIKVWMLSLVLYLVMQKNWRAIYLSLAGYLASMAILFTAVGWSQFIPFIQASFQTSRQVNRISVTHSIYGFANLHFRNNGVIDPIVNNNALFMLIITIGILSIVGGHLYLASLSLTSNREKRLLFGLTAISILLLIPPCQNEYLILCFPLLWTILAPIGDEGGHAPWYLVAIGILIYVIFNRPSPYAPVVPEYHHGWRTLIVSQPFFGAVLLWVTGFAAILFIRLKNNTIEMPPDAVIVDMLPAPMDARCTSE